MKAAEMLQQRTTKEKCEMTQRTFKTDGCPFGTHRVLEPKGGLPQPAQKINNNFEDLWDNEILIDVEALNIDSASFTQIKIEACSDTEKIKDIILRTVNTRGKQHNPVTGSGGIFIGNVREIGPKLQDTCNIAPGDKIVSLVSLSLTPLFIEEIKDVRPETDQIVVNGQAVLFESGIYAKMPEDFPPPLALAILDVCGAPAQTAKLVRPGDTVVIVGAGGKSGILCAYEAKKRAGVTGCVIGTGFPESSLDMLSGLQICDYIVPLDATDAVASYNRIKELTDGKLADVVINCVNVANTEVASVMMCRDGGKVYYFSMATSFTKAALGAEGLGKDVEMMIGNGYTKGHADMALQILRESKKIHDLYQSIYC